MSIFLEEVTVEAIIDFCRKLGMTEEQIHKKIIENCNLTEERARKYMDARKRTA